MTVQRYETVFVVTPETQGDLLKTLEEKIQKLFNNHKVAEI